MQEDARVQMLALYQALQRIGIVAVTRVELSISHHQVVLQGDEEARRSGVALPAGAAAELVVDPPALVLVGADHIEAAQFDHALAEADVGPAARHVRRDRHSAALPCPRDDRRFALVVAGIEDFVGHVRQQRAETLGIRDAGGADQNRLADRVRPADLGHHGLFLLGLRREDDVRMIDADHRAVGRYGLDLQAVDAEELQRLRGGGAGHAAYHRVQRRPGAGA